MDASLRAAVVDAHRHDYGGDVEEEIHAAPHALAADGVPPITWLPRHDTGRPKASWFLRASPPAEAGTPVQGGPAHPHRCRLLQLRLGGSSVRAVAGGALRSASIDGASQADARGRSGALDGLRHRSVSAAASEDKPSRLRAFISIEGSPRLLRTTCLGLRARRAPISTRRPGSCGPDVGLFAGVGRPGKPSVEPTR